MELKVCQKKQPFDRLSPPVICNPWEIRIEKEVVVAKNRLGLILPAIFALLILNPVLAAKDSDFPNVLSIRERAELMNTISLKRLELLIPNFSFMDADRVLSFFVIHKIDQISQ